MAKNVPFKVGDRVVRKYDAAMLTVVWVSKGPASRRDQLIATEQNLYCNPFDHASCYDLAAA